MTNLSSPAPFGDAIEPSPIQDANAFLIESLRLTRIECGPRVALMAGEVLGILSDNDGMLRGDLEAAVGESLEIRMMERGPIRRAIADLVARNVLRCDRGDQEVDDRFFLNSAVAALIGRDAA